MKKYYFISYNWTRKFWPQSQNGICSTYENRMQELIDEHPLKYQTEHNEKYNYFDDDSEWTKGKASEHIEILNWKEITKEEFEEYQDYV